MTTTSPPTQLTPPAKVWIWPAGGDEDAVSQYRLLMPAQALRYEGADVQIDRRGAVCVWNRQWQGIPPPDARVLKLHEIPPCDTIVMQRPARRWDAEVIPFLQEAGIRVVVDVDDDFHAIDKDNKSYDSHDPNQQGWHNRDWITEACKRADLVTASTPSLVKTYGFGHGMLIPNFVPARYLKIEPYFKREHTVGWTGKVDNHPHDLQQTGGRLQGLLDEFGWTFHLLGKPEGVQQALRLREEPSVAPYCPFAEYPLRMAEIDLGIVPLEDSRFNKAKCLDAATRVATERGLVPISEVEVGDRVWRDGRWRMVEAVESTPRKVGYLITTSGGRQLKLTGEHRLWANGAWTQARHMYPGDELSMTPDSVGPSTFVTAPWPSDGRASRGEHSASAFIDAEDAPRVTINERWGRFLGLFAGDGSASQTAARIHCDGQDPDLIEKVSEDFRQMGLWPSTQAVTTWGGEILRRRSVGASSTHFVRFLRSLGVVEGARRVVCVPEVIWRSPRAVVQAFLTGLFEADGTTSSSGVTLTTKHRDFACDVQRLLTSLGIEAAVRPKVARITRTGFEGTYWLVSMRRAAADLFEKEVGFLSERKQDRLAVITARPHSNAYRPMAWKETIVSIEPCELDPVDVQVEGSVFAAAGFVSHNSALKLMEFASLGVPVVASATPDNVRMADQGIGLVVKRSHHWAKVLKSLLGNEEYRAELAGVGRERMAQFTYEKNAWRWGFAWKVDSERIRNLGAAAS